jgi:nitroimidazol reductase NimA-like FMN-containing flavoprotein (pyridoxamine 5'-phosphate oxidase superfamily)
MSDDPDRSEPLAVELESLGREECIALLAGSVVGRLGLLVDGRPEILPVNYALDGEVVVFRTGTGTVLNQAALAVVAFEADRFDDAGQTGWSVLVQGVAQDVGSAIDRNSERFRSLTLVSWAPGSKERWFSIRPDRITGRRISVVPHKG